ncbi:MAG: carbon storage regulator [Clostridiales bacterium]|nr:carbon storage regulator [Clostridiales bacterium]MCF8021752.1 carbon storage regulator [Clostridiales bacterium]
MLVIGRKPGEYIMIDDKIKVTVIRSNEGDLRLAVDAPKEVKIVRGELHEKEEK